MRKSAIIHSAGLLILVIFAAAVLAIALGRGRLSTAEAAALWIVHDDAPIWDIAPRDALRGLRSNLSDFLIRVRENGQPPLYYAVLDVWTMVAGDSLLAARVLSAFAATISGAVLLRISPDRRAAVLTGVILCAMTGAVIGSVALVLMFALLATWALWHRHMGLYALWLAAAIFTHVAALMLIPLHGIMMWQQRAITAQRAIMPGRMLAQGELIAVGLIAVVTIAAAIPLLVRPAWEQAIRAMNDQRAPTDPAITLLEPGSPLAYFDRQPGIEVRQGISLDLAWREHSDAELSALVSSVSGAPAVWIIMPREHPETVQVIAALEPTHARTSAIEAGDMLLYRYERSAESEP